ncbi:MAG: ApaG domain [Akkermansia sp.]|nr:ApaG domain [Akkermansia sp.]
MSIETGTNIPERDLLNMTVARVGMTLLRRPVPMYKLCFQLHFCNVSQTSVRLLGRKWTMRDSSGQTRIIEAGEVFNQEPVLVPGAVFSYAGQQDFTHPPVSMQVRFFGVDQMNEPFITPPLVFPRYCFTLPRR